MKVHYKGSFGLGGSLVVPQSLFFFFVQRFCITIMRSMSLLALIPLVLDSFMGVTAQIVAAHCLSGWEWVRHLFVPGDAPRIEP